MTKWVSAFGKLVVCRWDLPFFIPTRHKKLFLVVEAFFLRFVVFESSSFTFIVPFFLGGGDNLLFGFNWGFETSDFVGEFELEGRNLLPITPSFEGGGPFFRFLVGVGLWSAGRLAVK